MKIIFKYILRYKKFILWNIVSVLFITLGEIFIPFIIGQYIINSMGNSMSFNKLIIVIIIFVFFTIIGNLIMNFCNSKVSSLIFRDLSTDLFKKIQTFSIEDIQNLGIVTVLNRSTFNIYQIMSFVSTCYRTIIVSPVMLLISTIIIFYISVPLSYGVLIVIPFFILILIILMKKNYKLSIEQPKLAEEINFNIRLNLKGTKVIRMLNQEKYEEEKFDKINSKYRDLIIKLFLALLSIEPLFYLLLNLSIILTIGTGAYIIKKGILPLDIGSLYTCVNLYYHILFSILNFLLLFMMFPKTFIACKKIESLFKKEPSIKNLPSQFIKKLDKIKTLEFKNVSLKRPNSSVFSLENISFKVHNFEVIAFVGYTGSGKTTLINLIPRLIDPTEGCIEINGINIKNYNLKELRDKIGFVSQKNVLFKGTIFSNLLLGKEDANEEEMFRELKNSQLYDFIQNKENKLNEFVSELGFNLSGGQKQRMSITRVFLKKPDIYIFDDSFSALDYVTDLSIRKSFFESSKDSICIIVAQRLNSILNADKIIVLDKGKIIDIGKHNELLKRCKIYKKLAISQNIKEVCL